MPNTALRRLTTASLVLAGTCLAACSDNSNNDGGGGTTGATNYIGLLASTDGQTGPLGIVFASPVTAPPAGPEPITGPSFAGGSPVAATGTMSLGSSGAIALTGALDNGTLTLTGSGWTVTGPLANGKLTGAFTGPGAVTGSATAVASTSSSPAVAYCGTFSGQDFTQDPPGDDTGTFSIVIAGKILLGSAVPDGGTPEDFAGTATSTSFTIQKVTAEGTLNATGTYNATSTNGTYNTKVGAFTASSGTFTGGVCTTGS